jgi:DNA-binding HxlR family transcriptional regulator
MPARSYNQYCSLAYALDVVGERWTLLIVRELMLGPRRFADLIANLPGVGRNLLTARLRHLEQHGLVQRSTLPPPAASRVYELTPQGRELGPAMVELSRWGVQRLAQPKRSDIFRPAWAMFPLSYTADPEAAAGVHETYEFRIDEETFHLVIDDGQVEPHAGAAPSPDAVFEMSAQTIFELMSGSLIATDALAAEQVRFAGKPEALAHALAILAGS